MPFSLACLVSGNTERRARAVEDPPSPSPQSLAHPRATNPPVASLIATTADFSGFMRLSTIPSESCSTMPHSIADPPASRRSFPPDNIPQPAFSVPGGVPLDRILQRAFELFSCGPLCTPFTSSLYRENVFLCLHYRMALLPAICLAPKGRERVGRSRHSQTRLIPIRRCPEISCYPSP